MRSSHERAALMVSQTPVPAFRRCQNYYENCLKARGSGPCITPAQPVAGLSLSLVESPGLSNDPPAHYCKTASQDSLAISNQKSSGVSEHCNPLDIDPGLMSCIVLLSWTRIIGSQNCHSKVLPTPSVPLGKRQCTVPVESASGQHGSKVYSFAFQRFDGHGMTCPLCRQKIILCNDDPGTSP